MAIENFADLVKLAQQKAFYDAGGGRTPEGTQWGQALTGVGQGLNSAAQGIDTGLELRKKALEQQRIGNIFGAPTPQAVQGQQSTYVAPNIFPQPTVEQENRQMVPSDVPSGSTAGQQPISPFAQKYNQVQGSLGLSPETPVFQAEKLMPELTSMQYKNALINNLNISKLWINPTDPSDVSQTQDSIHTQPMNAKDALNEKLKSDAQSALSMANEARQKARDAQVDLEKRHYELLAQDSERKYQESIDKLKQAGDIASANRFEKANLDYQKEWGGFKKYLPWAPDYNSYINGQMQGGGQQPSFQVGEQRIKGGVTYTRQQDGTWR